MILLRAIVASAAFFVATFTGRPNPQEGHCTQCLISAAAFGFLAAVILWRTDNRK